MNKLKIALASIVETLVFLLVALISVLTAFYMRSMVSWWQCALFFLVVAAILAWARYLGRVYGYGFEDDEFEEGEEET